MLRRQKNEPRFPPKPIPPPHGDFKKYKLCLKYRQGPRGTLHKIPDPPKTTTMNSRIKINFCIPLWNRAQHITELLENLKSIIEKTNEKNCKVWIADFNSTDIDLKEHIKQYSFPLEIVLLNPPFVIAKGLQTVADRLARNEIVYFVDADANLPVDIFKRLRTYVIKGEQFYCPMVAFQQPNGSLKLPPPGKDHGGKGHIGVFTDDFRLCNGWKDPEHLTAIPVPGPGPLERQKWGGHDGHLYNKLIWDHLNVYRPREADQYVKYHQRPNKGWYLLNKRNRRGVNRSHK